MTGVARVERALAQGNALLAYDLASAVLRRDPQSVRGRQLQALALARSGAAAQARRLLTDLRDEGCRDEETLGLLASVTKDLALRRSARSPQLQEAFDLYFEAYERHESYWAGINAATLALLMEDEGRARAIAACVRELCTRRLEACPVDERYWIVATIAEAALIAGDLDGAGRWYAQALAAAGQRMGHLASTRRNARLLLEALRRPEALDELVPIPCVAVFAGHRTDTADRIPSRFPPDAEGAVHAAILRHIQAVRCGVGYASAAAGGDILFLEAVLDAGGEIHVVLPFERDEFLRTSVGAGTAWAERFDRVLARAREVIVASPHPLPRLPASFQYANELLLGLAMMHARQFETTPAALALWDGATGEGAGGTSDAVSAWLDSGLAPLIIDPRTQRHWTAAPRPETERGCAPGTGDADVLSMLFADAVGYSRMTDAQVATFTSEFLGRVRTLVDALPEPPLVVNTWGDGLFFAQRSPEDGATLALGISALSAPEAGGYEFRIALHAGPATRFLDPLTGRINFAGSHVSRAARIEPVTPPGQVYASQAFVALLLARGGRVDSQYVGSVPLAKRYGPLPMYHLTAQR
ncbi:MAG TPA: adenylate/guanylate cyclase domain-containing protein [Vicinamibacterales bacterium]|nr:adenylate/guanylate cyclase domain-containing protein [Vicinamibacterales bacterium]